MTDAQKQVIIQLRDEYLYYARRASEIQRNLQDAMREVGLEVLSIDVVEPKKDVPSNV